MLDGTYEAIGPHFQGNPYDIQHDVLILHGMYVAEDFFIPKECVTIEDDMNYIREYLQRHEIEGLVFWVDGKPVCKIKRTDFGFEWPIKEDK